MKTNLLLSLLVVLYSFSVTAQYKEKSQIYYSRYEGLADSNIKVTANIVRLFNNISGNYHYQQTSEIDTLNFNNTITTTGDVVDEIVNLKEYGHGENALSGTINPNSFIGMWYSPIYGEIPFSLIENYPKGTMPFDVLYLHSENKLNHDSTNAPVAEIELTLIYPITNSNNIVGDTIKHIIANGFFGTNFYDKNPDSMLVHFENEYYTNYKDQNAGRPNNGASFNWQKIVNMSVVHNSDYLLCIEYLVYAYTGGAHGMTKISYNNVNLRNGQLLTYEDIFKAGTKDTLSKILTKQLYHDKKIPSNIALTEAGYFVDNIEPNHNFFVTNDGIGFLYNSYEIAPYSTGQTTLLIGYNAIENLIIEDSPIFKISNR